MGAATGAGQTISFLKKISEAHPEINFHGVYRRLPLVLESGVEGALFG